MQRIYPLLFVLLWSTGFIGAKFGLPFAQPLSFLLVRYLCVIAVMASLVAILRSPWPKDARQCVHIAITGILVHAFYLGGVFVAIKQGLPAGITALIVGMQPLITACASGKLLGEQVSGRQWLGLGLGFVGVLMVVSGKFGEAQSLVTMLLPAIVALLGITAGTLYQKRFCSRFDLRSGSVIQFSAAALVTVVAVGGFEDFAIEWSGQFILALGWLVLVLSIGAISLLNLLIRSGSAVNVASLFYLTPPTTALIAWFAFDEQLSLIAILGMAIAVGGVYLVGRPAK